MQFLRGVAVIITQLITGYLLGLLGAMLLGAGEGAELGMFALGGTIGVWGVGVLADEANRWKSRNSQEHLLGTVIGALIGVVIILIPPATGFGGLIFPFVGALLGYYAAPWFGIK